MSANIAAEYVIKRPLLSEKSTWAMNEQKRFSFEVDPRASKTEIKAAIEAIYKVRVVSVSTVTRKPASRRTKFGVSKPAPTKKAVVRLHQDDTIELF